MHVTRLSPLRRREDIRAWWSNHLQAQQDSGQTQAAYCRARGVDPKYFTLWKRKLLVGAQARGPAERPRLVPVVLRSTRAPAGAATTEASPTAAAVAIRLNLGNGMSLSLELAAGALPTLVRELAALRC